MCTQFAATWLSCYGLLEDHGGVGHISNLADLALSLSILIFAICNKSSNVIHISNLSISRHSRLPYFWKVEPDVETPCRGETSHEHLPTPLSVFSLPIIPVRYAAKSQRFSLLLLSFLKNERQRPCNTESSAEASSLTPAFHPRLRLDHGLDRSKIFPI